MLYSRAVKDASYGGEGKLLAEIFLADWGLPYRRTAQSRPNAIFGSALKSEAAVAGNGKGVADRMASLQAHAVGCVRTKNQ